jgi:ABC-2 type transport system permease protein
VGLFVSILAQGIAGTVLPNPISAEEVAERARIETMISRLSPSTLYGETVHILLNPSARVLSAVTLSQVRGILPTPLALSQSLFLVLPHITTLVALVGVCFGISYIKFLRDEIRT